MIFVYTPHQRENVITSAPGGPARIESKHIYKAISKTSSLDGSLWPRPPIVLRLLSRPGLRFTFSSHIYYYNVCFCQDQSVSPGSTGRNQLEKLSWLTRPCY